MIHEQAREILERLVGRVERVIVGKRTEIELAVVSMLSGGHILLEDVPGVGKTLLVRTLAACMGGSFGRIQFTSDLLPTDVTGLQYISRRPGNLNFVRVQCMPISYWRTRSTARLPGPSQLCWKRWRNAE